MEALNGSAVNVILFDVYGTLVEIRDKRAPFRKLIQIGSRQGRKPSAADAGAIMGQAVGLLEAAERMGIRLTDAEKEQLQSDLHAEVASIAPFTDTLPALQELKNRGFKLGVCSNLAMDYAAPVIALLPFEFDACVWSFDTAAIKPAPEIYAHACQQLRCAPGEVLMVGDTIDADVEGPRAFGMQALLLDRKQRLATADAIASLATLCDMVTRPAKATL